VVTVSASLAVFLPPTTLVSVTEDAQTLHHVYGLSASGLSKTWQNNELSGRSEHLSSYSLVHLSSLALSMQSDVIYSLRSTDIRFGH
jgi:hypothetical protein